MKNGKYSWNTDKELRTRTELSLKLTDGHLFFTAGKIPLATAVLKPDGKTLDVTIRVDRVVGLLSKKNRRIYGL